MANQIFGNLIGAFVIANVNQPTFYIILTLFCLASSMIFLFLRKPLPVTTENDCKPVPVQIEDDFKPATETNQDDNYVNPTLSCSSVDSPAKVKLEASSNHEEVSDLFKDLTETASLVVDRRMLLVEPLIMQLALNIAVEAAIMVPQMSLIISETKTEWDEAKTN